MRTRLIGICGFITGALVWAASPELQWPARLFTAALLGPGPAAFMLQAGVAHALERPLPRLPIYAGSIVTLGALGILAFFAATQSGFTPWMMGLRPTSPRAFAMWTAFAVLACASVVTAFKAFGYRESAIMREITPVTRLEKVAFVGLSVSAGVCEELTFRSFLMPALMVATGSLLAGVALSALAFGLLHAHQRTGGAVRAALLGAILTFPLLVTGSVYPSMAGHALVDIIGGLWAARWLLRS